MSNALVRGLEVEGEVVQGLIVGSAGRTYHGRPVVSCVLPPGLFGTRQGKGERKVEYTLHNGILNMCMLSEPPTPYWAVLDAAIQFKRGFTRKQAIDLAVDTVGEGKRRACEMAWDVLRNHQKHERKRDAGMAYIIEAADDGKLMVRARDAAETMQYFMAQASRKQAAAVEPAVEPAAESVVAPSVEPVAG